MAKVVKILRWSRSDNLVPTESGLNLSERLARRQAAVAKIKEPLLARLQSISGVEITNDLSGQMSAIVSAPPSTWKILLDPCHPVIPPDQVSVHSDEEIYLSQ